MNVLKKIKHIIFKKVIYRKNAIAYARYLGVTIGTNCRIYIREWGSEPFLISIGNNVTITAGTKFITHDGSAWLMRDHKGRRFVYKPIKIGNNVFIGLNTLILPGVIIEDNVIVAAGSVITKSIPSGVVVAGISAKIIGNFFEKKEEILMKYVSEAEIDKSLSYKNRVLKIVNNNMKPYLHENK